MQIEYSPARNAGTVTRSPSTRDDTAPCAARASERSGHDAPPEPSMAGAPAGTSAKESAAILTDGDQPVKHYSESERFVPPTAPRRQASVPRSRASTSVATFTNAAAMAGIIMVNVSFRISFSMS
jgi:hypothetical protein